MGLMKKYLKRIGYILFVILVTVLFFEIFLRMYNPFQSRLRGDKIVLTANSQYVIENKLIPGLDSLVYMSLNELGLRGKRKPLHFNSVISIITVGGSTTACSFLSDEKTWPYLLGEKLNQSPGNVWVNNAGMDGHSTFGHQVLLQDHLLRLKPKVLLFLTGVNDVENSSPTYTEQLSRKDQFINLRYFLYNNSEVFNLCLTLWRQLRAKNLAVTGTDLVDLTSLPIVDVTDETLKKRLKQQQPFIDGYRQRISQLIDTCLRHKIIPVIVTQPCRGGIGIDSLTKVNLETVKDWQGNGKSSWAILQLYNEELRKICQEKNVFLIDLATRLPKNSLYFYDHIHFTNEGAAKVADILSDTLSIYLQRQFAAGGL
jgi:lysophospholipase L1-like esterase